MNYPIWDVFFGGGILIAVVSILHVFVSHFAVGGGLFLVITERKAYKENNQQLLNWLQVHTKFFVLLTVVFGAITGVGIWFTIGLIHPAGTSALIHSFVWGWAIEWVFFILEITSALMYLYGWKKLDRKTHLWIGWVYFVSAFLSMVIINGIITFMLTSGKWTQTYNFWHGFFNPTYFPSLFLRFAYALALAGIYTLLTATFRQTPELKAILIKWSVKWIIPSFILLPFFALWYIGMIPDQVWESAKGKMPTASKYANLILIFSILTFIGSLLLLIKPKKVPFIYSLLIVILALITMWSFEFVRESIRKPFIIYDYLYANSIFKEPVENDGGVNIPEINKTGILTVSKWAKYKEITPENEISAGKEIFKLQCGACHSIDNYRSIKKILNEKKWSESFIYNQLGSLDKMVNNVMPPFAGTDDEKKALSKWLASLIEEKIEEEKPAVTISGKDVFDRFCSSCHNFSPDDVLFQKSCIYDIEQINYRITKLDSLNSSMPPFEGTDDERQALAEWIKEQCK